MPRSGISTRPQDHGPRLPPSSEAGTLPDTQEGRGGGRGGLRSRTSARRGRPRSDRVELVENIAALLADNPTASAAFIALELRARKQDVQRIVPAMREPARRFPKSEAA